MRALSDVYTLRQLLQIESGIWFNFPFVNANRDPVNSGKFPSRDRLRK